MSDVRAVLHDLRPALLEEQGLIAALDNEVRARTIDTAQADVLLELDDGDLGLRWPAEVEYAAFMIAREAIVNAQQRNGTTLVRVVLAGDAQGLQLEIIDDGRAGTGPLQPPPLAGC
jgi:signal transduction histidine kinase